MPPSHPRPEDLAVLSSALSDTGDHCAAAGEELLDHLVTVGDHPTQVALEEAVDGAADVLRELSASARELVLALGPEARAADSAAGADRVRGHR